MTHPSSFHEEINLWQYNLPITFRSYTIRKNDQVRLHWHDQIELLFFEEGQAMVRCGNRYFKTKKDDLIVVNSNELHQIRCLSESTRYSCFIFDAALLQSRHADACEADYISPIFQNRILFQNQIEKEAEVKAYLNQIRAEYQSEKIGYELAVKSWTYQLIVHLLRSHVQVVLTPQERETRIKNLKRFNQVLQYIDTNYASPITTAQVCSMVHISRYYFCHQFKSVTGSTLSEYVNLLRISKARELLGTGTVNVMEAAFACGFENSNYFSRLFKKYQQTTPSSFLNSSREKRSHPTPAAGAGGDIPRQPAGSGGTGRPHFSQPP